MRATIRYNREFGIYEVMVAGRVVYQTMDLGDANEYRACL